MRQGVVDDGRCLTGILQACPQVDFPSHRPTARVVTTEGEEILCGRTDVLVRNLVKGIKTHQRGEVAMTLFSGIEVRGLPLAKDFSTR